MLSSVDPGSTAPVTDAAYWGRNVRDAVQFWPAVDRLLAERDALFIEIGPHPVLTRPLRDSLAHRGRSGAVVSSLARGKSGPLTMAAALAALHCVGARVDWRAVHPARGRSHLALPPVPLARDRHWLSGVPRGVQSTAAPSRLSRRPAGADRRSPSLRRRTPPGGDGPGAAADGARTGPCRRSAPDGPADPADAPQAAPAGPRDAGLGQEQTARAVGRIAAEVLGVPGQRLSRVRGFYELGFDSFSIVELVARLGAEFGVELPAGSGLEHPTIDAMTEQILAGAAARPAAAGPVPEPAPQPAPVPAPPAASVAPPPSPAGPAVPRPPESGLRL